MSGRCREGDGEPRDQLLGGVAEPAVRDPDHALAGDEEVGVAAAVPFERGARGVVGPAVELEHERVRRPVHVDLVAGHPHVRAGRRQARRLDQPQEAALGLREPKYLRLVQRGLDVLAGGGEVTQRPGG